MSSKVEARLCPSIAASATITPRAKAALFDEKYRSKLLINAAYPYQCAVGGIWLMEVHAGHTGHPGGGTPPTTVPVLDWAPVIPIGPGSIGLRVHGTLSS